MHYLKRPVPSRVDFSLNSALRGVSRAQPPVVNSATRVTPPTQNRTAPQRAAGGGQQNTPLPNRASARNVQSRSNPVQQSREELIDATETRQRFLSTRTGPTSGIRFCTKTDQFGKYVLNLPMRQKATKDDWKCLVHALNVLLRTSQSNEEAQLYASELNFVHNRLQVDDKGVYVKPSPAGEHAKEKEGTRVVNSPRAQASEPSLGDDEPELEIDESEEEN